MNESVLQIWEAPSGMYGGRLLCGQSEDGRIGGCHSADEVKRLATKVGMKYARFEQTETIPAFAQ